jgi:hypothetical protein
MRQLLIASAACAVLGSTWVAGQQPAPAPAPQATPTITLAPGLRPVPDYTKLNVTPEAPAVPEGFTSIFNGRDLTGWHVSKTARHGLTPDFHVAHGMILGTQRPYGAGGILLTDRAYRDFEFYMEARPDFGNDSGIFFRTTESGAGYQITMDYLPGGSMGRFIAEGGIQFGPTPPAAAAGAGPAPRHRLPPGAGIRRPIPAWRSGSATSGTRCACAWLAMSLARPCGSTGSRSATQAIPRTTPLAGCAKAPSRFRCTAARRAGSPAASGAGGIWRSESCRNV